jgi:hypothetical protein
VAHLQFIRIFGKGETGAVYVPYVGRVETAMPRTFCRLCRVGAGVEIELGRDSGDVGSRSAPTDEERLGGSIGLLLQLGQYLGEPLTGVHFTPEIASSLKERN